MHGLPGMTFFLPLKKGLRMYDIEEDRFRNKMIMDDKMGNVFMSGIANERIRIFNRLREMDLGDIDVEQLIRKLVKNS